MDGTRIGTYFTPNNNQNKRKKIQVVTLTKANDNKNNYYNQYNPYALTKNPSTPHLNKPVLTQQTSNRDTARQSSNQKSIKMVRSNGLNKVQKPNIANSQVSSNGSSQDLRLSTITPNYQHKLNIKYSSQHSPIASHQINGASNIKPKQLPQINHFPQPSPLQQQNTNLKLQNMTLKQKLINMKKIHNEQIKNLKQNIQKLFHSIQQLQQHINIQDIEWLKYKNLLKK